MMQKKSRHQPAKKEVAESCVISKPITTIVYHNYKTIGQSSYWNLHNLHPILKQQTKKPTITKKKPCHPRLHRAELQTPTPKAKGRKSPPFNVSLPIICAVELIICDIICENHKGKEVSPQSETLNIQIMCILQNSPLTNATSYHNFLSWCWILSRPSVDRQPSNYVVVLDNFLLPSFYNWLQNSVILIRKERKRFHFIELQQQQQQVSLN